MMNSNFNAETILFLFSTVIFFSIILMMSGIKVVPEDKRLQVYRLGQDIGIKGPGLVFIIPFIDLAKPADWPQQDQQ